MAFFHARLLGQKSSHRYRQSFVTIESTQRNCAAIFAYHMLDLIAPLQKCSLCRDTALSTEASFVQILKPAIFCIQAHPHETISPSKPLRSYIYITFYSHYCSEKTYILSMSYNQIS